jgi:O-succinylbenzoate synthase
MKLWTFSLPLRHRFRGLDERIGMLVERDGRWAEFSPFSDYTRAQRARWRQAAWEALTEELPPALRATVPVNVTVPEVDAETAHRIVASSGCTTAKVKVGDREDEARVEAVRDALGAAGHIRVDVNAAWDVDRAVRGLRSLMRYDLQYAEQPVATIEEMRELRRRTEVPLAVDESLRKADHPAEVDLRGAADVAVLKVAPLGGVRATLQLAERLDMPVVISSALESSIGLAAGVAAAAALDDLPYACGLATAALLEDDVVSDPLLPVGGEIPVRMPQVDRAGLDRLALDGPEAARLRAWFEEER